MYFGLEGWELIQLAKEARPLAASLKAMTVWFSVKMA